MRKPKKGKGLGSGQPDAAAAFLAGDVIERHASEEPVPEGLTRRDALKRGAVGVAGLAAGVRASELVQRPGYASWYDLMILSRNGTTYNPPATPANACTGGCTFTPAVPCTSICQTPGFACSGGCILPNMSDTVNPCSGSCVTEASSAYCTGSCVTRKPAPGC